ncbi:uncharacterized protein LOC111328585 [Stylophora pistillata]|nr:uncharacterized protein LOC111328585 [Stylophora pistillata]XP_022788791.1 uncharacterized protein LOC111328585 [Stylophora pistillata]XP_022788792.1 uncharacterized protein LOC111328585 [Stylophora pistillata]XP_022788793.1 uncharacterized protein LOC111328585 [Stylophora pistillata]
MASVWTAELDKKEHKNWVMVGCALNITKNGITQLIQRKMETWYQYLISSPPLHSLSPHTCTRHSSKCATCTTWKKELERLHKSPRPKICWDNSDRQQWGSPTGAWEIAKVFMPTLGTRKGVITDSNTTDIGGLLNILEWCPFINPTVNRAVLSAVRDKGRNHWAHSPKQELEDSEVNTIFGHLNNLLNDPVFNTDKEAQKSAKDLQDLSHDGLLTARESEVRALQLLRQTLVTDLVKCKEDLSEVQNQGKENRVETVELREQLAGLAAEVHATRSDLRKGQGELLEAQGNVRQLDAKITKSEEFFRKEIFELKGQNEMHREEIVKLRQQCSDIVEGDRDLKKKLSQIIATVENFNSLVNERDDLQGSLEVISEDLDEVASCMRNIVLELNITTNKVANLGISLDSVKSEVKEVKSEVETLKEKSSNGQEKKDIAALCTAPCRLQEFTGREPALVWLEQNLVPDRDSAYFSDTSCCTKTICGLGGCGKTSLAVEFVWRSKKHFKGGVFWINGETDENVSKSVAENLALLNIPASTGENLDDSLNRFLAFLSNKSYPWLLVVDNADELTSPKCPSGVIKICKGPWQRNAKAPKYGHILFTTRQNAKDIKTLLKLLPKDCWELQSFTEEEGALFLMRRTGLEGESPYKEAIDLAKELGGLPLALEQAAAYISALPIPCTFKAYLDKYRDVKLRLLEQQPVTAFSVEAQHRLSVHTTWEMNFEFVAEKSPAAATMMRIASFLESENIPFEVINSGLPVLDQVELRKAASSEIDIAAVLKLLTCYSLFSVDQKSRVFGVHKLVQEVVRDSLSTPVRTKTLNAAMRLLHHALRKKSESSLKLNREFVENWSELNEEDRNIIIALLLNIRKLKDHLQSELKSSTENFVHCTCKDRTFIELFGFVNRLIRMNIFFNKLKAELSEFELQVEILWNHEDPNRILDVMANTCVNKRNCSDVKSYNEAKKLAEKAVQRLHEFENSGATIDEDVKYRILEHQASYYAMEKQWEKNHKALLELESLKLSPANFVDLQMLIARAENYVSACNFKPALERHKNALRLARKLQPTDWRALLRVLQHIGTLLLSEGKRVEAKPYAEEMLEVCKKMPHMSDYYIRGMTDALHILSSFDSQKSEALLLKVLQERWPRIYKSVINCCTETSAIEDGSDDHAARILECLVECWCVALKTNKPTIKNPAEMSKVPMYLTIAKIALAIRTKFYGETHSGLQTAYRNLIAVHLIGGNKAEAQHCMQLLEECSAEAKAEVRQGLPPCDSVMYATRKRKELGNKSFKVHDYDQAYLRYSEALSLSPNDAKLLTNRAATCLKLSERQCSVDDKQKWLRYALDDSQNAIKNDPAWEKGYRWKAVCLAHLGKRDPSLATAAIARHLFPSKCTIIPAVVDRFGNFDVHVVNTVQDFQFPTEKTDTRNLVIVVNEGRYQLTDPLTIPKNTIMVGHGNVQITCYSGVPLRSKKPIYMENIVQSSIVESMQSLKETAKAHLDRGQLDEALAVYDKCLALCPNNSKILTSRASTYLKSAQQQKGSPLERKSSLQLALSDTEAAIKADPSWLLGYRANSVTLAELGRKPEALAAAAVFKHLSLGRDIPEVTQHYGEIQVHVLETSDQLRCVIQNVEKVEGKNLVVVIKEGEYQLERSVEISVDIVIVGLGRVSIACKRGDPFRFTAACHVENVEMTTDCDSQEESHECSSNDTEPEVIRLATPSGYDNTSNECKVD